MDGRVKADSQKEEVEQLLSTLSQENKALLQEMIGRFSSQVLFL